MVWALTAEIEASNVRISNWYMLFGRLRVSGIGDRVSGFRLWTMDYGVWTIDYKLRTIDQLPKIYIIVKSTIIDNKIQ